jgi:transcriptional regulator with XRE-family HTH domain
MAKVHQEFIDVFALDEAQARLAAAITEQRTARNWTQRELATRSGASPPTIQRLATKGLGNVNSLLKIVRVLGLLSNLLNAMEDNTQLSMDQRRRAASRSRAHKGAKPQ